MFFYPVNSCNFSETPQGLENQHSRPDSLFYSVTPATPELLQLLVLGTVLSDE
jgi:hypothetical protein